MTSQYIPFYKSNGYFDCVFIRNFMQYMCKRVYYRYPVIEKHTQYDSSPTLRRKGEFSHFEWEDEIQFYIRTLPKHYPTMDKRFAKIGKGMKEKTNSLSRGAPTYRFIYKNF